MNERFDIFISYKRISIETANNLYYRLTQKGYSVFFDLEEMRTDKFPQQIENYIKNAKDVFILLEHESLSACYNGTYNDDWFCKELQIALANKKHIIPMLLKDFDMPAAETLPEEIRGITEYNAPKFDIAFFDAYIDKLISKKMLYAEAINKESNLSVFKFYSTEDCKVYEGKKIVCTLAGQSDEPFYLFVKRKGQYRYKCVNNYTMENKIINVSIDSNEEQLVDISWPERTVPLPENTSFTNPVIEGDRYDVIIGAHKFRMIRIAGGEMFVGATEEQTEAEVNEQPAHKISVKTFYMSEFPITQTLWSVVMGYNKSRFKEESKMKKMTRGATRGAAVGWNIPIPFSTISGAIWGAISNLDNGLPAECISLFEAREFVKRLSSMTKIQFTLPSEEEWEYAARGGQKSRHYKYSGSNDIDEVAWYKDNSDGKTHPVGKKKPNELGLYDMSGNIWEWTETPAHSYLQNNNDMMSEYFIRRGGSWWHEACNCRVAKRYPSKPDKRTSGLGLRVIIRIEE